MNGLSEKLLNRSQVCAATGLDSRILNTALALGAITPDFVDPNGRPFFKAEKVQQLAELLTQTRNVVSFPSTGVTLDDFKAVNE